MSGLPFVKMHGLGNDFVIVDARSTPSPIGAAAARAIAERRTGVGCDQLLVMEPPSNGVADAFMRVFNADGGEAGACGNGARCVAALIMAERDASSAVIETRAGLLRADAKADGHITVDMGRVWLDWDEIPLAHQADTLHLDVEAGPLSDPAAVGIGNPHAVFFVADADAVLLEDLGPEIEHHPLFPERTNVEVVQVHSPTRLRVRVWERGAGLTLACGSGACAAVVAAHRRGLAERSAEAVLDGGALQIEWRADGRVSLAGPVAVSFQGTVDESLLAAAAGR